MPRLSLAAEFPAATRKDWEEAVAAVLRGASFDETLRSRGADGLSIEPVYARALGATPIPGRVPGSRWAVLQRMDHPDVADAHDLALADLEGGADGLVLTLADTPTARGFGLATETAAALERALDGVMLDILVLRLEAGRRTRAALALLAIVLERRGLPLSRLMLSAGYDPVGILATRGRLSADWPMVERRMGDTVHGLAALGHQGAVLRADGRPFHEAGATEAQELAAVLASALATMRGLEAAGFSLEDARRRIDFTLVADTDAFMTLVKFRAMRRLWARIEAASGLTPHPIALHGETAFRTMTRRDPWSNLLRGTIAAFGAGVGGADSVTVLPFTTALGLPDAFARRVARNAQHVLMAEAHLHRLADPAAGSGAFEALTEALCAESWRQFQAIEREGGIVRALTTGWLQAAIARTREERAPPVIVGVTRYTLAGEEPVATLGADSPALAGRARLPIDTPPDKGEAFAALLAAARDGATLGDLSPGRGTSSLHASPLPVSRDEERVP